MKFDKLYLITLNYSNASHEKSNIDADDADDDADDDAAAAAAAADDDDSREDTAIMYTNLNGPYESYGNRVMFLSPMTNSRVSIVPMET